MNRFVLIPVAFMSVLVVAACDQPSPAPAPATTTAPVAALTDEDLAVPADFADEAEQTITSSNYKTELDSLETELN
jgi:hypothetical protein